MQLRKLEVFLAVCDYNGVSPAARSLYMSQPAVSQVIAELESTLEVRLFERLNKRLVLTHAGETLQNYSRRILNLVNEARWTMEDLASLNSGRLRIGASTTIGIYMLPQLLCTLKSCHPNIDFPFVIDNTAVIETMILHNDLDVALVEGPLHSPDIVIDKYYDDELCIICSPEHPWARTGCILPEDLNDHPFIIREKGSGTREIFEKVMLFHQLSFVVANVLNNTEAIKRAVAANLGISVVSRLALNEEFNRGVLHEVKIQGVEYKRDLNIMYHKDKHMSPLLESFISVVHH